MNGDGEEGVAPAGRQVNLALAAALLSGIRPTAITVDLAHDGTPAALTIDTPWGTEIKDTHRVFQALGITDPAVLARPETAGRTRVDIDDSDTFDDPFGRLGIPITITVDNPTTSTAAEHATTGDEQPAEVIDLADYRTRHTTTRDTDTDTDEASTTRSGEAMTENTPTPQAETGARWRDITVTYPDGRQRDPYHVLDNWRPGLYRSPTWVNQQIKFAAMERADRDAVIAFADQLDPADTSDRAQHLRDVADEARDHNTYYDQRAEWAAALLQADPTLADRIDPAARHDAEQLLHAEQAAQVEQVEQAAHIEQAADVEPVEATRDARVDDATDGADSADSADSGSDPAPEPMTRAQLADALWEGRLSPAEAERLDPRLAGMAEVFGMSEAEANTRTNHAAIDWETHLAEDYSLDWQDQLAEDRAAIHDADDDAWGA